MTGFQHLIHNSLDHHLSPWDLCFVPHRPTGNYFYLSSLGLTHITLWSVPTWSFEVQQCTVTIGSAWASSPPFNLHFDGGLATQCPVSALRKLLPWVISCCFFPFSFSQQLNIYSSFCFPLASLVILNMQLEESLFPFSFPSIYTFQTTWENPSSSRSPLSEKGRNRAVPWSTDPRYLNVGDTACQQPGAQ